MYFATGWPRLLRSPLQEGEEVRSAKRSPDGRFLVVLSSAGLQVWSGGRQRLLLACCAYEKGTEIAWAPDSKQLAVLDSQGLVRLLELSPRGDAFEYRFTGTPAGRGLAMDEQHRLLEVKQRGSALDLPGLGSALASAFSRLLVATRCGRLLVIQWNGREEADISLACLLPLSASPTSPPLSGQRSEISASTESSTQASTNGSPADESLPLTTEDESDQKGRERESGGDEERGDSSESTPAVVFLQATSELLLLLLDNGSAAVVPLPFTREREEEPTKGKMVSAQLLALEKEREETEKRRKNGKDEKSGRSGKKRATHSAEWLTLRGATALAYSSKHRVIAVGHSSGEVSLFQEEEEDDGDVGEEVYDIIRMFSLVHWGISPEDVGAVRQLRWSPDGAVVAVGWERRGAAVWSLHGCRLMCTVPQLEGCKVKGHHRCHSQTHSSGGGHHHGQHHRCDREEKEEKARAREPLSLGTAALEWAAEGYWLFAAARGVHGRGKGAEQLQISFVKSALVTQPNLNYCPRLVLMGEDRLLLLEKRHQDLNDVRWAELPIPHAYLTDNWPLRRVAVSRRGTDLAVAGRRGLCLYSTTSRRWRLFGDQRHEQEIVCCGLAWFRTSVLVASAGTGGKYELLAFPRDHLAASSRLLRHELPERRRPTALDCNDRHLVIFTKEGFFFHYRISEEVSADGSLSRLHLQLLHQVSSTSTASLSSLLLLPAAPVGSPHEAGAQCLLLDGSGRLCVSSPESGKEAEICANIEQFWYGGTASRNLGEDAGQLRHDSELANSLWAYGEGGLHVWFPFLPAGGGGEELQRRLEGTGEDLLTRDVSLEFDLEVYPVGFVPELGIVVGLAQGLRHCEASPYPQFVVRTRTHPFLHSVLRHILLEQENFEHALAVATRHSSIPHFLHSLELLLHESLDACQSGGHTGGTREVARRKQALSSVVDFLKTFQEYPEVVVRCARKTDASHWPLLFSFAGEPLSLFQACLSRGFLASAASYLRVLHLLGGTMQARKSAYALLEALLAAEDFSLLPDLLAFLSPERLEEDSAFEASHASPSITMPPRHRRTASPSPTADEESYLQDMVLGRHARKLLAAGSLRLLLLFARKSGRELRPWLLRERDRAAVLPSLSDAFTLLHRQFQLPYLEEIPSACRTLRLLPSSSSLPTEGEKERSGSAEVREFYPQPSPRLSSSSSSSAPVTASALLSPARLPSLSRLSLAETVTTQSTAPTLGARQTSIVEETRATGVTFVQKASVAPPRALGPLRVSLAVQRQLEALLLELYSAQCMDWALVVACALFNAPVAQEVLLARPRLRPALLAALALQQGGAYKELGEALAGTRDKE